MDDPKFPEPVTVSELRADLRRILETVHYFRQRYLIMRNGDAMAILLALEDFRELVGAPGAPVEIDRK
jgi:PHD/YefM family antitoxin component YafN of YafNO toxin-antitoxin module